MIYLSKGIIKLFKEKRKEFESKIIDKPKTKIGHIRFASSTTAVRPYILKVTRIEQLYFEFYLMVLSDGNDEMWAVFDMDQFNQTSSLLNDDNLEFKIKKKSIIILTEIAFSRKTEFCKEIQDSLPEDEAITCFVLREATLIGTDEEKEHVDLEEALQIVLDDEADDEIEQTSTTIQHSHITPTTSSTSKKNFQLIESASSTPTTSRNMTTLTINEQIVKIEEEEDEEESQQTTEVTTKVASLDSEIHKVGEFSIKLWVDCKREFSFMPKFGQGKKLAIRYKCSDETGCLEATAFENIALKFQSLELKKWYLFEYVSLNVTPSYYHVFASEVFSSQYDLLISELTTITRLYENNDIKDKAPAIPKPAAIASSSSNAMNSPASTSTNKRPFTSGYNNYRNKRSRYSIASSLCLVNYIKLTDIPLFNVGSIVNVIGLITSIGEMQKFTCKDNSVINLLHVYIRDLSDYECRVAFWGEEADAFDHKIGTVMLFKDIEINNFKGITLSVQRKTSYFKITSGSDYPIYDDLIKMWEKTTKKV